MSSSYAYNVHPRVFISPIKVQGREIEASALRTFPMHLAGGTLDRPDRQEKGREAEAEKSKEVEEAKKKRRWRKV